MKPFSFKPSARSLLLRKPSASIALALAWTVLASHGVAATVDPAEQSKIDRFLGIYQALPIDQPEAGGLRGRGDLTDLPLTPAAIELQKNVNLKWDAARNCRIVGPARMMAMPQTRFELYPTPSGGFFMLYNNASLGNRRRFEFRPDPAAKSTLTWMGHSAAKWKDANTFVVQTTGYNKFTWLNSKGAPHSDALLTTEVYHLLANGDLQLTFTVTDPAMLTRPFTYVRYYQRQKGILGEVFCDEESWQNP